MQRADVIVDLKGTTSSSLQLLGHRLFSQDGADIIAVQKQGITFSRLAPYDGWESFVGRFLRDWEIWRKKIEPLNDVCRVGIRYINRIDIPVSPKKNVRIEDYFDVSIRTPDPDMSFGEYLLRMVSPIPHTPFVLILTKGSLPSEILNHCSFVLDIDIFCENQRATSGNFIDLLTDMRAQKNKVFEEMLTAKAKELFA